MAGVDELDSLLDSTLDDFAAEAASPVASPMRGAPADATSTRLMQCVARLESSFGSHADFDLLKMIIADEVTGLEQTSHPNTTDGAAATASPTKSPAKAKAKATESNSGSGGLFQKGFLNNANDKKKPKESSGKGGRGKAVDKGIDDALAGLKQSKENVAGAGTFPGMPPEMAGMPGMPQSEEEMAKMLEQLMGGADGGGDGGSFMNEMVEGLFSKAILYPSLTEVNTEYGVFLKDQKDKASVTEYAAFEGQHIMVREMIGVFDNNALAGGEQAKQVMALMEKMSALGSPPEAIMTKLGLQLGPDGMPMVPGSVPGTPGCCVM